MKDNSKIPLIASEIAGLWDTYMNDSSTICIFKHFLNNIEDKEIRKILQHALSLSEQHVKDIEGIFNQENITIPCAFGEDDVDTSAPRLFTDAYYLSYLSTLAGFGADAYSLITRYTGRLDIQQYFIRCLTEATELLNKVTKLRLSKGLYLKAPRVEVSKKITFIEKESFLSGLLGEPRPLLAREATNVFAGILMDIVWRALLVGFGQVTTSKQVRDFMFKGRDITSAHLDTFTSLLNKENIPISSISDSFVTDSTVSPFSDKLMMYQTLIICSFAIGVDGAAIASSMRSDLLGIHTRFGAEIIKYVKDGVNIMIDNRWMEQPPQVIRHESLATV